MSDIPKTLFVNHTAQLGGAELSLLDLATRTPRCRVALFEAGPLACRLDEAGVFCDVIDTPVLDGIRRDTRLLSGLVALRGIWQAARGVAKLARGYDVLYANSQKSWVVTALASMLCRKPTVWHLHDILSREHFSQANIRVVVTLANRFADRVIANSCATRDAFVQAGGKPGLVRVIYNGIDPAPYQTSLDEDQTLHTDRSEAMPVVACVGRLSPWKGQHVFLDALAKTPGVRGWVIGAALFGEDEYARSLYEQAKTLGIAERVEFLGFCDNIPALLRRCDMLAHTSTAPEPFGRVLVEAMFAGAAVIATRGGGPSEMIKDRQTGRLVSPNDPAGLADAIKQLAADPQATRRQVQAAYGDAMQRFTLDIIVQQVHDQLNELAGIHVEDASSPRPISSEDSKP